MFPCYPEKMGDKEIYIDSRTIQIVDEIRTLLRELEDRNVPSDLINEINRKLDILPSRAQRFDSIGAEDFLSVLDETTVPWDNWESPSKASQQEWRRQWPTARGILRKEIKDAEIHLGETTGIIPGTDTTRGTFYISDEQLGFISSSCSPITIMWDDVDTIEPVQEIHLKLRTSKPNTFQIRYRDREADSEKKIITWYCNVEICAHSIAQVHEYNKYTLERLGEVEGGGRNSLASVMTSMIPSRTEFMKVVAERNLTANFDQITAFYMSHDDVWEFYNTYFTALGHWDMKWGDDEKKLIEHPEHGGLKCGTSGGIIKLLSMQVPIPKTLFTPDSAECEVVFQKIIDENMIIIESSTITIGVPASDCFSIKQRLEITPSVDGCDYKLFMGLCWTKSSWLESIVVANTNSATEKAQPVYVKLLEEEIAKRNKRPSVDSTNLAHVA